MATIDISRRAFDPRKHYAGVRMQQGRVMTDDDWNENERIENEDRRRARVDIIGPCGSPDEGFRIANPSITDDDLIDFDIGAGTFYLGGLLLDMEELETFRTQKDFLLQRSNRARAPDSPRFDLVYLLAWQQPVSAVEDSELFEVALGGPDTSMRLRNMRQVRIHRDIGTNDCVAAWEKRVDIGRNRVSLGEVNEEHKSISDTRLTVSFIDLENEDDLCAPSDAGGYLGAENQAIRVQLVGRNLFTWGYDNAAPLYRVQVSEDNKTVTLLTDPKDEAHWPLSGQIVEILPRVAELSNGEKLARMWGHLSTVASSYNPDEGTFTLINDLPEGFGEEWTSDGSGSRYFFMRVWNRGSDRSSGPEISFKKGEPVPLGHTGLQITITGNDQVPGDYWIIAARPETPDTVVPWELEEGIPPHGVRRFFAPLAVIQWKRNDDEQIEGEVVHDCRKEFLPLTQQKGCCSFTVGHGSSIQAAIERLPATGGEICVLPGEYNENIVIDKDNVKIHGCGRRCRLVAGNHDPAVHIAGAQHISISDLEVHAHTGGIGILLEQASRRVPERVGLTRLHLNAATRGAIEIHDGKDIVITDNVIGMHDTSSAWPGIFVKARDVLVEHNEVIVQTPKEGEPASVGRGGIQIAGTSAGVRIEDNLIQSGIGNGITLGSVHPVFPDGTHGDTGGWWSDDNDPCPPCFGNMLIPTPSEDDEETPTFVSDGALYEITIAGNRIFEMGLNGIGVIGFYDLEMQQELISIEGLKILGNEIRGCLQRRVTEINIEIDSGLINLMGYGGISLADVEDLVIQHNFIEDNGADHLEPVCGIFVLHGQSIDISDNRIANNGPRTSHVDAGAKSGRRSGINIVFATSPPYLDDGTEDSKWFSPRLNDAPALKVHDNTVIQPLGRALSVAALGPVSVVNNQLTTRGMVSGRLSPSFRAANVWILNLGVSFEYYGLLLQFKSIASMKLQNPTPTVYGSTLTMPQPVYLGNHLPVNGNVLFSGNQCLVDFAEPAQVDLSRSAIVIRTLDDIGFHNNQCDAEMTFDFLNCHVFLFGFSVRASNNRLKEGIFNALYSAVTLGAINSTTVNQTTHCNLVLPPPPAPATIDVGNTEIISLISGKTDYCNPLALLKDIWGR